MFRLASLPVLFALVACDSTTAAELDSFKPATIAHPSQESSSTDRLGACGHNHGPATRHNPADLTADRQVVELPITVYLPPREGVGGMMVPNTPTVEDMEARVLQSVEKANEIFLSSYIQVYVENVVYDSPHIPIVDQDSDVSAYQHTLSTIPVFVVYSLTTPEVSYAGYAVSDTEDCQPTILLDSTAGLAVLAHELGHVWGLSHNRGETNLMDELVRGVGLNAYESYNAYIGAQSYQIECGFGEGK